MNPNTQANQMMRTWLDACGIPHSTDNETLSILKPDGEPFVPSFSPRKVMSTDLDVCMGEFHSITEAAGYGKPMPINRGKAEKKRIFKDPLLARWRHTEMRTVPNMTTEALSAFEDIAKREAYIFLSRNPRLAAEMGYDLDVAINDARIWINTFNGRYALQSLDETRRLLTNYLRQRFTEVSKGMQRERRNVIPDSSYTQFRESMEAEKPPEEWMEAHDEIKIKTPQRRREKVREMLKAGFDEMGHGQMLETLDYTSKHHPCVDTRKAAAKYLGEHKESCETCGHPQTEEKVTG